MSNNTIRVTFTPHCPMPAPFAGPGLFQSVQWLFSFLERQEGQEIRLAFPYNWRACFESLDDRARLARLVQSAMKRNNIEFWFDDLDDDWRGFLAYPAGTNKSLVRIEGQIEKARRMRSPETGFKHLQPRDRRPIYLALHEAGFGAQQDVETLTQQIKQLHKTIELRRKEREILEARIHEAAQLASAIFYPENH